MILFEYDKLGEFHSFCGLSFFGNTIGMFPTERKQVGYQHYECCTILGAEVAQKFNQFISIVLDRTILDEGESWTKVRESFKYVQFREYDNSFFGDPV